MSNDERLRVLHGFDRAARLEQTDVDDSRELRTALNGPDPRGPGNGHDIRYRE